MGNKQTMSVKVPQEMRPSYFGNMSELNVKQSAVRAALGVATHLIKM